MTKYAHTIASFIKIKQISNLKYIIHVIPVNFSKRLIRPKIKGFLLK